MENIINLIVVFVAIFGWYILIKDILDNYLYRNIELDQNIKLQMIVKNQEENIEMIIKKILNAQNRIGYFKQIEIIDENSNDQTYEILKDLKKNIQILKYKKCCKLVYFLIDLQQKRKEYEVRRSIRRNNISK